MSCDRVVRGPCRCIHGCVLFRSLLSKMSAEEAKAVIEENEEEFVDYEEEEGDVAADKAAGAKVKEVKK